MAASQKIKVSVAVLIKAIDTKIEMAEATYETEKSKYEQDVIRYRTAVKEVLEQAVDDVIRNPESSRFFTMATGWHGYGSENVHYFTIDLPNGVKEPTKPNLSVAKMKRDRDLLAMSADETIAISSDSDWVTYL